MADAIVTASKGTFSYARILVGNRHSMSFWRCSSNRRLTLSSESGLGPLPDPE